MNGLDTRFLPLPSLQMPINPKTGARLAPTSAQLAETAKEFEATFLSLLLKEMRQSLDSDGGGFFPGDSGDIQGGLFDLFLGKHLAEAGGFGLAPVIERQLRNTTNARPVPPSAGAGPARAASS